MIVLAVYQKKSKQSASMLCTIFCSTVGVLCSTVGVLCSTVGVLRSMVGVLCSTVGVLCSTVGLLCITVGVMCCNGYMYSSYCVYINKYKLTHPHTHHF